MVSPVRGLRPVLALRLDTVKVPNPETRTSPPVRNVSVMFEKTHSTACVASVLDKPQDCATALIRSFLFTFAPLRQDVIVTGRAPSLALAYRLEPLSLGSTFESVKEKYS